MGKQQLPLPLHRASAVLHGSSSGSQGVTWVSRPCGMQTSILKRPAVLWCMSYCKAGESEVAFPAPQCIRARLALEAQRWKREMKQFGNLPELSPGKQTLSPTVLPDQLWLAASKSLRKTMCWTLNLRPDSGVSMETDEPAVPHQLYSSLTGEKVDRYSSYQSETRWRGQAITGRSGLLLPGNVNHWTPVQKHSKAPPPSKKRGRGLVWPARQRS